jgi:hypothetical protein
MDAYDLPEEFSHLQAQDMGKIGFISDIVRGIKKIIGEKVADSVQGNLTHSVSKGKKDPETIYSKALTSLECTDLTNLELAKNLFVSLGDYKDSKEKLEECRKKIKEKKELQRNLAIMVVALIVFVAIFVVIPIIRNAIKDKPSTPSISTESQTTYQDFNNDDTQPVQGVKVTDLKINLSSDDVTNNYTAFDNPIQKLYFHYDVALNGAESVDLLFVITSPYGGKNEYVATVENDGNYWYSNGYETNRNWLVGTYNFKIYDNDTSKLLLSKSFTVSGSSGGSYTPNITPDTTTYDNSDFETLTFSGTGDQYIRDINLPQGTYVITIKTDAVAMRDVAYLYNFNESLWETYVETDDSDEGMKIWSGSIENGYIEVASDNSWTITIEAY